MGPTCYVQAVQSPKGKGAPGSPQAVAVEATKPLTKAAPKGSQTSDTTNGGHSDVPKLTNESVKKKLFDQPQHGDAPTTSKVPHPPPPGACELEPGLSVVGEEAKRLVSETRRLLLCHQEHAMTLTELVESFAAQGDPAHPTAETLYPVLEVSKVEKFEVRFFFNRTALVEVM